VKSPGLDGFEFEEACTVRNQRALDACVFIFECDESVGDFGAVWIHDGAEDASCVGRFDYLAGDVRGGRLRQSGRGIGGFVTGDRTGCCRVGLGRGEKGRFEV